MIFNLVEKSFEIEKEKKKKIKIISYILYALFFWVTWATCTNLGNVCKQQQELQDFPNLRICVVTFWYIILLQTYNFFPFLITTKENRRLDLKIDDLV